ncbi:MAG: hypothetical protein B6U97_04125 [Candidatus Altiarchaeales archaeon ex4484_96]|nr:MAG: hypothetical protein B6U97_04125 [Candidatus Altiarchaeales archaeon ex4484_96]
MGFVHTTIGSRELIPKSDVLFYKTPLGYLEVSPYMIFLFVFVFVVALFISLSQELGRLFPRFTLCGRIH